MTKIIVRNVGWIPVVERILYIHIDIDIDIVALSIKSVVVNNVDIILRNMRIVYEKPKLCHWMSVGSGAFYIDIPLLYNLYWLYGL